MASAHPAPPPPGRPSIWSTVWPAAFLAAADVAGFSAAWMGAWHVRRLLNPLLGPINAAEPYQHAHLLVVLAGLGTCVLFGLYFVRRRLSSINKWERLLKAGYHHFLCMLVVGYFLKELDLGRSVIMLAGAFSLVYLYASRSVFRQVKARALRSGRGRVRAAIVGAGELAATVMEALSEHQEIGFDVVGFIRHASDPADSTPPGDLPVLGSSEDLPRIVRSHHIEEVFVAAPHLSPDEQLNLINLGESPGLRVQLVSNLFGVIASQAKIGEIGHFPVITLHDGHLPWHQKVVKRTLDLVVASAGATAWLLFFHWWIALWIRRDSPGPVFFVQERIGLDGRPFRVFKYRTMRTEASKYERAPTSQDDPRVTIAGRWLRKTSLDELPQLINVLRGEMSMVGPRPEMPFIVEQYQEWQKRRLDVKPGITGLWQVIGRKNLPLHLNMEYDFYYIRNQSLLLDIEILMRTAPAVLKGRGAF